MRVLLKCYKASTRPASYRLVPLATSLAIILGGASGPPTAGRLANAPGANVRQASGAAKGIGQGAPVADLLAHVADRIGYEAYRGALRGGSGTLVAGSANAADKALLLHDLITKSNPAADLRFATCTLGNEQSEQLVEAAGAFRPPPRKLLIEAAAEAAVYARDPATRERLERAGSVWRRLSADLRTETQALSKAIEAQKVVLGHPLSRAALRDAVRTHVWLQQRDGDAWIDLDPTIPRATPGRARCQSETAQATLPDAMYHRLVLRVKVEERRGNALQTRYLLEASQRTADLDGTSLTLLYAEPLGLDGPATRATAIPPGMRSYTPALWTAGAYKFGQPFFLRVPESARGGSSLGLLGNSIGGVFGKPVDRARDAGPAAADLPRDGEATAAWLQIDMVSPDLERDSLSVSLFDRKGFAERSESSELGPVSPLPEADGEYRTLTTLRSMAVWTGGSIAGGGTTDAQSAGDEDLASFIRLLGRAHAIYYDTRGALFETLGPSRSRMVVTRPSVSLLAWTPTSGGNGEADLLVDLLSNHARPLASDDRAAAAQSQVGWSVSSLLAERLLANVELVFAPDRRDSEAPYLSGTDVLTVFSAAREQRRPFQLLRPADILDVNGIPASAEARARLRARLTEGKTVLLPASPTSMSPLPVLGWWLIDLATGSIQDEMEDGRHGVQTGEYSVTNEPPRRSASLYQRIGCYVSKFSSLFGFLVFMSGAVTGNPAAMKGAKDFTAMEKAVLAAIEKEEERRKNVVLQQLEKKGCLK